MQMVDHIQQTKREKIMPWIVCFCASLFFFYEFIQGNMFASIADNIMHDFHIQADGMAYLSSIYYLSNVIFLFVAGMVFDRFSTKKIILFAMFLCVMGTFILAYSHSFYWAMFCRFLTGIGSAFCFLGPIRLASRWFPPERMAMITGMIITMAMTGGLIAQYPLTVLVVQAGWRNALMDVGWLGLVMLIIMMMGIVDKGTMEKAGVRVKFSVLKAAKLAYLNSQTLCAAFYTSLMNMAVAIYGAMIGSLYLMQRMDISKEEAAVINSMLFFGAIVGGPVVGWCSDKLGQRILPMKIGVIASLITMLAALFVPVSVLMMKILFFLLGFFTASQVISYALVAERNPSYITAMAVSVVSILTQGGYIVYQNIFSHLLISHGGMKMANGVPVYSLADYQYAAWMLPTGLVLAIVAVSHLKDSYCRSLEG